ncbi:MAG: hypothetical protein NXY57DRAFT_959375 [Lentinula lateritia]|nr:MAG: hypothetical protein NXY57DRAFT_959375 [Lentinula lateritia]
MLAVSHMFSLFFLLSIVLGGMCFPLDRRDRVQNYRSVPIAIRTKKMSDGIKADSLYFGTLYSLSPIRDSADPSHFKGSRIQRKPGFNNKLYIVATADFGWKTTTEFTNAIEHLGEHRADSPLLWMHETLTKMVKGKNIDKIPQEWIKTLGRQGFDKNANRLLKDADAESSNGAGEAVRSLAGDQAGNHKGSQEVEGSGS